MTTPKAKSPTFRNTKIGVGIGGTAAIIIATVLGLEGGYVNNPKDPGGETNHGVTKAVARAHGYQGPMKDLTKDAAASIYYEDYIRKPGFSPMLEISPAVAEELVDSGVNTGPARPSRWFQQALNSLNRDGKDYPQLTVDGKVGPATYAAYRGLENTRGKVEACQLMLKLLDAQQASYYMSLTHLKTFTPGWVSHRIGNVPLSKCKNYGDTFHVADPDTAH